MSVRTWTLLCLLALACFGLARATPPYQDRVLVPAYGPGFNPSDDLLKEIRDEVRGLRKDVQGLRAAQQANPDDGLAVLASRCASCHTEPASKGGDFMLVDREGNLAELSVNDRKRIVRKVTSGQMPPSGKLPEAELKALAAYFSEKQSPKDKEKSK